MERADAAALPPGRAWRARKEGFRRRTRTELSGSSVATGGERDTGERNLTSEIVAPRRRDRSDTNTTERRQNGDETTRGAVAEPPSALSRDFVVACLCDSYKTYDALPGRLRLSCRIMMATSPHVDHATSRLTGDACAITTKHRILNPTNPSS